MSDNSDEGETVAAGEAVDEPYGGDRYATRRRRLVFVAWFVCGAIFLTTAFGLAEALWGTRPRLLFASSYSSPFPGDTERVMRTWELSRSGNFTEALEESEAIALDPTTSKEERCTAQAEVAYAAWRLGETDVALGAIADFEKQCPALKIDPAVLDQARRTKDLLDGHFVAQYLNSISGTYWEGAPKTLQNLDFTSGLAGWELERDFPAGQYVDGINPNGFEPGKSSAFLSSGSAGDKDWDSLGQATAADKYRGKRVELTAEFKTDDVARHANLWMSVDTPSVNFYGHAPIPALSGTIGWKQDSIVLDVPLDAQGIAVGIFLRGSGKVSLADVHLDVVGKDIPTTPAESRF